MHNLRLQNLKYKYLITNRTKFRYKVGCNIWLQPYSIKKILLHILEI